MARKQSATATNNEVVNPQTASAQPKAEQSVKTPTLRVVETRDMWAVVFDHTATLLAKALNGEAVEQTDTAGFAFGKQDGKTVAVQRQQPNIRPYRDGLLAGFASRKALKHAKGTALEGRDLYQAVQAVILGLHPQADVQKLLGKAEPKQAKSLVEAVIAKL